MTKLPDFRGRTLGDGKAHAVPARRHLLPVREVAAGGLAAAFDQMPGERAGGEAVPVLGRPAELVDQRAQGHGAVDHAAGDDDIGARIQRRRDRERAEVGVGTRQLRGQRLAVEHLAHAARAQFFAAFQQLVTFDGADFQRHAGFVERSANRLRTRCEVHAAGIGDHADLAPGDLAGQRLDHLGDEVGRVTRIGRLAARLGENRHGHFGEVVEHQVLHVAVQHELLGAVGSIAPVTGGAADAYGARAHAASSSLSSACRGSTCCPTATSSSATRPARPARIS